MTLAAVVVMAAVVVTFQKKLIPVKVDWWKRWR